MEVNTRSCKLILVLNNGLINRSVQHFFFILFKTWEVRELAEHIIVKNSPRLTFSAYFCAICINISSLDIIPSHHHKPTIPLQLHNSIVCKNNFGITQNMSSSYYYSFIKQRFWASLENCIWWPTKTKLGQVNDG